jgi:hypothetical protein
VAARRNRDARRARWAVVSRQGVRVASERDRGLYNVPLYRYVRFGQRLLLGDGDLAVFVAGLTALLFGTVWMVARLAAGRQTTTRGRWGVTLAGALVLLLLTSTPLVALVLAPCPSPPPGPHSSLPFRYSSPPGHMAPGRWARR